MLESVRYASVNLLCCLAAPRLAGASLDFVLGSLDSSLQFTGELSHADVYDSGCCRVSCLAKPAGEMQK